MQTLKYLFNNKPEMSTNEFNFRAMYSFKNRLEEADRVLSKHKNMIPIIIEKANTSNVKNINKHKWLVPIEFTVAQFILMIRQQLNIDLNEKIFLFVNNDYKPSLEEKLGNVYNKYKDADNFLYCTYSNGKNEDSNIGHLLWSLKFW
jgi:GABA(A) receptor-associated protein